MKHLKVFLIVSLCIFLVSLLLVFVVWGSSWCVDGDKPFSFLLWTYWFSLAKVLYTLYALLYCIGWAGNVVGA